MKDKIIVRSCPFCLSKESRPIVCIRMRELFELNQTYDKEWFKPETIDPDFAFPIVECENCKFNYSKYKLPDHLTFKYYNEGILKEESLKKIYRKEKRRGLVGVWNKLNELAEWDAIKLLDYGAGWGDLLAIAKCHGVSVYGLEFDKRKIEFAAQNGIAVGDSEFICEHAPYNVFFCNQVLEHLNDPLEVLRKMRTLLIEGAVGFISVPNFSEHHMKKQVKFREVGRPASKDLDPVGHLNYFTPGNLRQMARAAGFQVLDPVDSSGINTGRWTRKARVELTTHIYVHAV